MKELTRDVKATMGIFEGVPGKPYGLLAEYTNPAALLHAAEKVRAAGYRYFDTHSPFPIHGMDRAMGLPASKVGWLTFGGGLTGLLVGLWLQWWTGGFDYPINVGGRPFFAVELSIPVTFELTILFSAFAAVGAMLALNGLPRPYNPLFYSKRFVRATDDGFFLHIAATDKRFDLDKTRKLLQDIGATHVEVIEDLEVTEEERAEESDERQSAYAHGMRVHTAAAEGERVR